MYWGPKIYENDTASDIRITFPYLLRQGLDVETATKEMIADYSTIFDKVEEPLFWFALADTQWKWGVLLPYVKEKALYWIEKGGDIEWWEMNRPKNVRARRKIMEMLRVQLLSPLPPPKKYLVVKPPKIYKCQWKIGDVFAFRLESELAKEKGLYGRHLLLQKVDEKIADHILPVVYVKLTKNENYPTTKEEFDELEYIQVGFARYEDRFYPIDMKNPQEDIAKKSEIEYKLDAYGYLPVFRIYLRNSSKSCIPAKLIYIGNFADTVKPEIEFIPHGNVNITSYPWGKDRIEFEERVIQDYFRHNKRESPIYRKKPDISPELPWFLKLEREE